MEKVNEVLARLTAHFDAIPKIKLLADKIGCQSGYIAIGFLLIAAFLVFSEIGSSFVVDVVSIAYPAYMSFKAIETKDEEDDKQWLTYWVVAAVLAVFETFLDFFFFWLPFYFFFKLLFIVWCAFPETRGALLIYNKGIRPYLVQYEKDIDSSLS
jgi:receptor expression-enhancing protein 5/6